MNVLINALSPYIVPAIIVFVGYFAHRAISYIPAQQRAYAKQWADIVVAMVEQQFAGRSAEEKKQIAMDAIKGFFTAFNLPCPPDAILSALIEAAVNALPSTLQGGKTA